LAAAEPVSPCDGQLLATQGLKLEFQFFF
jgi:hypothetical protein